MFEFAINQNKRHKPSARAVYSFISSCALHLALLLVLIENPHFLDTGISRWFRAQLRAYPTETREWRPVALLSTPERMTMPSPEVLKQAMYDWEAAKGKGLQPPVRVSWSAEQLAALADAPPVRPVPGLEEPQPAPPATAGTEPQPGTETGKEGGTALVYLPPPEPDAPPKRIPEKVAETAPAGTPEKPAEPVEAPAAPERQNQARVFANQQAAIRSQESGLFDTKGFPMGDYATAVIERVRSNWFIPSNLRSSQGSTTIVFYIAKDGRFMDARIVEPSGSSSLDLAALSAVIGSNPFPPLPAGFPADRVGAKFVFSYNERP